MSIYSPQVPAEAFVSLGVGQAASLEALFSENDVVIELEGFNQRTRGIVGEAHLRSIPDGGVFVNCGRAGIVDEGGLIAVARDGVLQVGLDVFHDEPLPEDSPLRGLENVILTPHVEGPTGELLSVCGQHAVENLKRWVEGEPLHSQVSLAHFDNMT